MRSREGPFEATATGGPSRRPSVETACRTAIDLAGRRHWRLVAHQWATPRAPPSFFFLLLFSRDREVSTEIAKFPFVDNKLDRWVECDPRELESTFWGAQIYILGSWNLHSGELESTFRGAGIYIAQHRSPIWDRHESARKLADPLMELRRGLQSFRAFEAQVRAVGERKGDAHPLQFFFELEEKRNGAPTGTRSHRRTDL